MPSSSRYFTHCQVPKRSTRPSSRSTWPSRWIFPIMICISSFVNGLHLDLTSLMDHADPFLPEGVLLLFQDYLTYIDTNQSSA